MKLNQLIRSQRKELGLKADEVADAAGLASAAYRDIELYEDEAYTVADLRALRSICALLKLDLLRVFGIECQFCNERQAQQDYAYLQETRCYPSAESPCD